MKLIIADTSCLILFTKIDRLDVIQNTFSEVVTTDKVIEEYGEAPEWLEVRNDYDQEIYQKLSRNFGVGESSCMSLSMVTPNSILIIDDRRAKKVAQDIGIECIGSLGVLLIAKRQKTITAIGPLIDQIKLTDFRVSDDIIAKAMELAGEK